MSRFASSRPLKLLVTALALSACSTASQFFDVKSADVGKPGDVSIATGSNDLRVAVIGNRTDDAGTRTVTCVEPVGPAALLQNFNGTGAIKVANAYGVNGGGSASFAVDGGPQGQGQGYGNVQGSSDVAGNVGIGITQAIGQIYQVGEIMQLVHTMSFRYCEAFVNGSMSPQDYIAAVENLTTVAQDLMYARIW